MKLAKVRTALGVAETGQSRSQQTEVRGRLDTSLASAGDPLLQLGAIVALSADRYSGLYDDAYVAEIARDLTELEERLRSLDSRWVVWARTRTSSSCWSRWRPAHARKRRRLRLPAIAASRRPYAAGRTRHVRVRPARVSGFRRLSARPGRTLRERRPIRGRVRRRDVVDGEPDAALVPIVSVGCAPAAAAQLQVDAFYVVPVGREVDDGEQRTYEQAQALDALDTFADDVHDFHEAPGRLEVALASQAPHDRPGRRGVIAGLGGGDGVDAGELGWDGIQHRGVSNQEEASGDGEQPSLWPSVIIDDTPGRLKSNGGIG